jgi:hypothetical protein
MAFTDSKGDEAKLEGKLVEVIEEETTAGKREPETAAVELDTSETNKSQLKAAISATIQEAKGDLTVLQEKLKNSFKKEPEDPYALQEIEIEQAINESQKEDRGDGSCGLS